MSLEEIIINPTDEFLRSISLSCLRLSGRSAKSKKSVDMVISETENPFQNDMKPRAYLRAISEMAMTKLETIRSRNGLLSRPDGDAGLLSAETIIAPATTMNIASHSR